MRGRPWQQSTMFAGCCAAVNGGGFAVTSVSSLSSSLPRPASASFLRSCSMVCGTGMASPRVLTAGKQSRHMQEYALSYGSSRWRRPETRIRLHTALCDGYFPCYQMHPLRQNSANICRAHRITCYLMNLKSVQVRSAIIRQRQSSVSQFTELPHG